MTSVVFLGTPQFAVPILQGLFDHGYEILGVVTQPDKKVGRKQKLQASPVKQAAQKLDLPLYQPVKLSRSQELDELIALQPDFLITAAYGQFLPTKLLQAAKIAPVNVHGSLLPKYRGGAPIQYALLNGDHETGITIMQMVKEMDAGLMYAQEKLTIEPDDTAGSLFAKLSIMGRDLLLATLPKLAAGTITGIPQDSSKVVFSPTIKKAAAQIKTDLTAEQAANLVRALNPDPGAFMLIAGKRLKIWRARASSEKTSQAPGTLISNKKRFAIAMAKQTVLDLVEVQAPGKKRMSAKDFANGQGSHYEIGQTILTD
ncbi:MAG: methionyl-tRNA formyltransferase [Lactobacillus sp.]|jgi:methionyl-tRNA formyltransferase|nr:methionyl-tRNA formyltransferase [Lactobacillus sp.]MCH3906112.1 methionyl-tRNA formyltransferase [Lactobacillus sp.]MCH3990310.1 methionyl-tRNA formyltransferase [Lactobacillus sp.]MCH4068975.1 methionyl-tRNA formyltransferase [Lactobacillus sp.]MCI1303377.1 methionyl-tRNA formyltransferase [Lactobacillus sp.]